MKKLLVLLVVALFAAPAIGLATQDRFRKIDSNAEVDSNAKLDFNNKCAKCHRATKSLPKMAKLLEVNPETLTLKTSKMNRDEMIAIIEKGRGKMPGFEKELTKERITDIVDYVIFLRDRKRLSPGWYGP